MNISRGAHFIFPLANIPIWVVLLGKKMLCGRKFLIILRTEVCSPTRHSHLQIFLPESYWKPYNQRSNCLHLSSALKLLKDLAFILYIVIRHVSIQLGLCLFVCFPLLCLLPSSLLIYSIYMVIITLDSNSLALPDSGELYSASLSFLP